MRTRRQRERLLPSLQCPRAGCCPPALQEGPSSQRILALVFSCSAAEELRTAVLKYTAERPNDFTNKVRTGSAPIPRAAAAARLQSPGHASEAVLPARLLRAARSAAGPGPTAPMRHALLAPGAGHNVVRPGPRPDAAQQACHQNQRKRAALAPAGVHHGPGSRLPVLHAPPCFHRPPRRRILSRVCEFPYDATWPALYVDKYRRRACQHGKNGNCWCAVTGVRLPHHVPSCVPAAAPPAGGVCLQPAQPALHRGPRRSLPLYAAVPAEQGGAWWSR